MKLPKLLKSFQQFIWTHARLKGRVTASDTNPVSCTFILSTRTCSCILLYDTDLKQGSDVHVEAQVGKPCSDDFGTSVMTVLPHFCHQQSRVSALLVLKFCNSDIKRKKNKKKKTLCYSISPAISMFMMAAKMLYTYCGSWRSLHAPRTRCGKRRSPSWCWPCVRQTPSSWRQLFRQPNIWKPKKKEAENTLLSTFSLYSYLKWGIHVIHFHFTFNKLNAIFLAIS